MEQKKVLERKLEKKKVPKNSWVVSPLSLPNTHFLSAVPDLISFPHPEYSLLQLFSLTLELPWFPHFLPSLNLDFLSYLFGCICPVSYLQVFFFFFFRQPPPSLSLSQPFCQQTTIRQVRQTKPSAIKHPSPPQKKETKCGAATWRNALSGKLPRSFEDTPPHPGWVRWEGQPCPGLTAPCPDPHSYSGPWSKQPGEGRRGRGASGPKGKFLLHPHSQVVCGGVKPSLK